MCDQVDLQVRGSSLACRIVFLDKELWSTVLNGHRRHTAGGNPAID